jgi:hypothetical protein
VAAGALVTRGLHWGLGRHIYYLSPDQIQNAVKYIVLMTAPVVTGVMLGRISFCLFLLSTVGAERSVRATLWITLILQALVNVIAIILQYSSCGLHFSALWNHSIHARCLSYQSIYDYLFFLGGSYPRSARKPRARSRAKPGANY